MTAPGGTGRPSSWAVTERSAVAGILTGSGDAGGGDVMTGGDCILVVGVIGLRIHRRKRAHEQDGKDEMARRWAHKKTGLYGLFQANVGGIILRLANA